MISNSNDIVSVCASLAQEKLISEGTLHQLCGLLESTEFKLEMEQGILNLFDDIDRINCKSMLLLVYIKWYKYIPTMFVYWPTLNSLKNLPCVVLQECLKDTLNQTSTSWLSSTILIGNDFNKRDIARIKEWFDNINGKDKVNEMLRLNKDLTTCINVLKFIRKYDFNYEYFETPRILNFINSINPVFTNLYQVVSIKCHDIKEFNLNTPDLLFMQIINSVLILWVNSTSNWFINLCNLKDFLHVQTKLKLGFKKLKSETFNTVSYRMNTFTLEVDLKNSSQVTSFINKLKNASILKPRKISISLLDYTHPDDFLYSELTTTKSFVEPHKLNTSVSQGQPRHNKKIKVNDETDVVRNLMKQQKHLGYQYSSPTKEDALFPSPRKKPQAHHSPILKRLRSQRADIQVPESLDQEYNDDSPRPQISTQSQLTENSQLSFINSFEPLPELKNVLPIAESTNENIVPPYSPVPTSIRRNPYDSVYGNLNTFGNQLVRRMKKFENQIIEKKVELNNELNDSFEKLMDEHNAKLHKLGEYINLKRKEIFEIDFDT